MKKLVAIILALVMILSIAACSKSATQTTTEPKEKTEPAAAPAQQETKKEETEPKKTVDYPVKPITIIVPWTAGGGADNEMRIIVEHLPKFLPNNVGVVIENVEGGAAITGTVKGMNADPDGYTLLMCNDSTMVMQPLQGNGTHSIDDFTPICGMSADANFMGVLKSSGWNTVADMIQWIKDHPGEFIYSTGGTGGEQHICMYRLFKAAGVEDLVTYIPTNGVSESVTALLGGHVHAVCALANQILKHEEFTPLVSFGEGTEFYGTGIPTVKDSGYEYTPLVGTRAVVAPKGLDPEIQKILFDAFKACIEDPEVTEALKKANYNPCVTDGEQLAETFHTSTEIYRQVFKELGIID